MGRVDPFGGRCSAQRWCVGAACRSPSPRDRSTFTTDPGVGRPPISQIGPLHPQSCCIGRATECVKKRRSKSSASGVPTRGMINLPLFEMCPGHTTEMSGRARASSVTSPPNTRTGPVTDTVTVLAVSRRLRIPTACLDNRTEKPVLGHIINQLSIRPTGPRRTIATRSRRRARYAWEEKYYYSGPGAARAAPGGVVTMRQSTRARSK